MDERQHQLNEEGRSLWDQKAAFWDSLHGEEGNNFHKRLISPSVERLLALKPGERVLDVACGGGVMARRLAALGAHVTATDFSAGLIERAQMRGQSSGQPIDYRVVDATDEAALVTLGESRFDAVICTMALMDMPAITPLYRAVRRLLRPSGRFIVATAHPAFNSNNPVFVSERVEDVNETRIVTSVKITLYNEIPPYKARGADNDPAPHYYYHRPLHVLLGEAFAAGLVMNGIEEPVFSLSEADPSRPLAWRNSAQVPPVIVARFILK